jgi:hypothetical protein
MEAATIYLFPVQKREREWEIIRLRARGEYLGTVSAPDEQAALRMAVKTFALDKVEAKRLLVRQCR